ncbi:hypothetical protein BDZ91DRAFT_514955 [Kalaharituber pfeilii]|nr:hypothetical protein BDZ91DRAFT_514955 [Kalaharituber pfeilii]
MAAAPVAAAGPPKLPPHQPRPRAPSSVYTSAPDFEVLNKPDAPNLDEFDDTGRFASGKQAPVPPKPIPKPKPKPVAYQTESTITASPATDSAGALVPAGYNYGASGEPPAYWKPPPFRAPRAERSNSDSTAMVITSQQQRPPPPQYNSAANSRRNSFIGDSPIPPSLMPGVDPSLADEIEREMRIPGAPAMGGMTLGQQLQQLQKEGVAPAGAPGAPGSHAPPAPYIEEVNDREDGGRRRSAQGAAGMAAAAVGGVMQPIPSSQTALGDGSGSSTTSQLIKHRFSYKPESSSSSSRPALVYPPPPVSTTATITANVQTSAANQIVQSKSGRKAPQGNSGSSMVGPASSSNSEITVPGPQPPSHRNQIEPPPKCPSRAPTQRLDGIPFSPDAYNAINPKPSKMPLNPRGGTVVRATNNTTGVASSSSSSSASPTKGLSGRVPQPDEILPPETYAPEPEPKPKSAAQLQAEMEAEMQVQLRKSRGITGAREMGSSSANTSTTNLVNGGPLAYPPPKLPISIPERGSSSRVTGKKQLALPPPDATPPPPPAHQALTLVNSGTKTGTVRNKLQKVRTATINHARSIDTRLSREPSLTTALTPQQQHQQAQSLSMQIAQHEARMAREAEHAQQRLAAAREAQLAKQQAQQAAQQQTQRRNPSHRHSVGGAGGGLGGYASNPHRHSMVALPPPPGYGDFDYGGSGADGDAGAMVLHRHRSAEPVNWEALGVRSARSYESNVGGGGYDQGMVLYRPDGGAAGGGGGSRSGYGYNGGYGSSMGGEGYAGSGYGGSNASGRSRGGSAPPPPPPGLSGQTQGQGQGLGQPRRFPESPGGGGSSGTDMRGRMYQLMVMEDTTRVWR